MTNSSVGWLRVPSEVLTAILHWTNVGTAVRLALLSRTLRERVIAQHAYWRRACAYSYDAYEPERRWFLYGLTGLPDHLHLSSQPSSSAATAAQPESTGTDWFYLWCWFRQLEYRWQSREATHTYRLTVEPSLVSNHRPVPLPGTVLWTAYNSLRGWLAGSDRSVEDSNAPAQSCPSPIPTAEALVLTPLAGSVSGIVLQPQIPATATAPQTDKPLCRLDCAWSWPDRTASTILRPLQTLSLPLPATHLRQLLMDALYTVALFAETDQAQAARLYLWHFNYPTPTQLPRSDISAEMMHDMPVTPHLIALQNDWLLVHCTHVSTNAEDLLADQCTAFYRLHAYYLPYSQLSQKAAAHHTCYDHGCTAVLKAAGQQLTVFRLENGAQPHCTRQLTWCLVTFTASDQCTVADTATVGRRGHLDLSMIDEPILGLSAHGCQMRAIDEHRMLITLITLNERVWMGVLDTRCGQIHQPAATPPLWQQVLAIEDGLVDVGRLSTGHIGILTKQSTFMLRCLDVTTGQERGRRICHAPVWDERRSLLPVPWKQRHALARDITHLDMLDDQPQRIYSSDTLSLQRMVQGKDLPLLLVDPAEEAALVDQIVTDYTAVDVTAQ